MPSAPADRSTADGSGRWWLALALAALSLAALAFVADRLGYLRPPPAAPDPRALITGFAALLKSDPAAARGLLGPQAAFDLQPVSADEAERRSADFYLRSDGLKVVEVLDGVPDDTGKQKPAEGWYTLVTRGQATTPPQVVRTPRGQESPARGNLLNPDVIVEVRGGKIHALRTELPLR